MLSCFVPDLISIIVASYNYAHFLPLAIESALAQRGVNVEIIVIDDGSTDNTADILSRYRSRIVIEHQANQGLSSSRNRGISLAHGEFLIFLDADDFLWPDTVLSQINFLRSHPESGMAVCRTQFFSTLSSEGKPLPSGQWRLFLHDLDIHLLHFNIAPPHAVMIRRDILEKIGRFDISLLACEDYDMWLRAMLAGAEPVANPYAYVAYRRHKKSMSQNRTRQYVHDAILHERAISAYLAHSIREEDKGEGGLACIAGCLQTACRLETQRPETARNLRNLAMRVATKLSTETSNFSSCHPMTQAYFIARIMLLSADYIKSGSAWALSLSSKLERALDFYKSDVTDFEKLKITAEQAHNALTSFE